MDERRRVWVGRAADAAGQLQLGPEGLHLLRLLPPLLRQHGHPRPLVDRRHEAHLRRGEPVHPGEEGDGLGALRVRQPGEDGNAPRMDRDIQASESSYTQLIGVLRLHVIGDRSDSLGAK